MDALTYGDSITVDFTSLPEVSQRALAQRGLTHVLGNEVASRVHSWAQAEGQANSEDKAAVTAWKAANADKVDAKTAEVRKDMLDALASGTLGERGSSGPRLSPVETIKRRIARGEITTILQAHKIKVPKGEDKVKMHDGEFTMNELIDRRLAKPEHGERIAKAAEKELAAKAKAIAAAAANAEEAFAGL